MNLETKSSQQSQNVTKKVIHLSDLPDQEDMSAEICHLPIFDKYELNLVKETTEAAKETNKSTIIKCLVGHILTHNEFVYCLYESKASDVKKSISTILPGFEYEFWHVDTYGTKKQI